MLADPVDLNKLVYPVLASPKLDGVRATFVEGQLLTRSLKPIPNLNVQQMFKSKVPLDGELIVGDPTSSTVFRDTMKVVSAFEADIYELRFHVFDLVSPAAFQERLYAARHAIMDNSLYVPVPHSLVHDEDELLTMEDVALNQGYEGLMLRAPHGKYKFGRATTNEGILLKMKRRKQSEAQVIEFVEQMHNANEAKIDNLGNTERSSHQANMVPMGVLGALTVKDIVSGVQFNIGTGFTAEERAQIWKTRDSLRGKYVTYEYLPIGIIDKPRHPVFLSWRMGEDI